VDAVGDSDCLLRTVGGPEFKKFLNNLFSGITFATTLLGSTFSGSLSLPVWDMPALHNLGQRMPPVAPENAEAEAARLTINWLSTAGTGVFVAALLSGLVLKLNATQREAD
jgi:lactate permease